MQPLAADDDDQLPSSERVYLAIKQAIFSGDLPPHQRLVELSLARRFGVSRTPVREALKRLCAEGLATVDPTRGTIVRGAEPQEVEEIYAIREVLDGLAARMAARTISETALTRLAALVDVMSSAIEETNKETLVQANIRFHGIIYQAAGNQRLSNLNQSLTEFVRRFSSAAFESTERDVEVVAEHGRLLDALRDRDESEAERVAREHMVNATRFLVNMSITQDVLGAQMPT